MSEQWDTGQDLRQGDPYELRLLSEEREVLRFGEFGRDSFALLGLKLPIMILKLQYPKSYRRPSRPVKGALRNYL